MAASVLVVEDDAEPVLNLAGARTGYSAQISKLHFVHSDRRECSNAGGYSGQKERWLSAVLKENLGKNQPIRRRLRANMNIISTNQYWQYWLFQDGLVS